MRTPILSVLALVTGCSEDGGKALADPVPFLELPESIEAEVVPGQNTVIPVLVKNTGTVAADARATVTGDFSVPAERFTVDVDGSFEVQLSVSPASYDALDGTLTVTAGTESWSTQLVITIDPDVDGDGFLAQEARGDDCDDTNAAINPGADELCSGIDENCNGEIDDGLATQIYYPDTDNDGFGDALGTPVEACKAPTGFVADNTDCDDSDDSARPGATEVFYDGVDQDCLGGSDFDQDGDGEDAISGKGADCNDLDVNIFPGAVELDDHLDNDCDSYIDEDIVHVGDLLITEIFTDPQMSPVGEGEWVEFHNVSDTHIDIDQVRVTFGDIENSLAFGVLPPDAVYLACGTLMSSRTDGLECDEAVLITNKATRIIVTGPQGEVDRVDATGWAQTPGRSIELASDKQDDVLNDAEGSWCEGVSLFGVAAGDRGTPGVVLPPCP
jgi:hypothetical protein